MRHAEVCAVLNRVLGVLYRSLPTYLQYAAPWTRSSDQRATQVVHQIVTDQQELCGRLVEFILEHHCRAETGEYPMEYTGSHDLSMQYLVGRMIDIQRRDITTIETCVARLHGDLAARSLAEEALGLSRGHLESLEELRQAPAGAGA